MPKICEQIPDNRRLDVRKSAEQVGISVESYYRILTGNVQTKRVVAEFVSRPLTSEQKENRLTICQDLYSRLTDLNFLKKIITGDGTRVYGYDPETAVSVVSVKNKTITAARKRLDQGGRMPIVFLDMKRDDLLKIYTAGINVQ